MPDDYYSTKLAEKDKKRITAERAVQERKKADREAATVARITRTTAQLGIKQASKAAPKKGPDGGGKTSAMAKKPAKKAATKKAVDPEAEAAKAEAARAAEAAEAQRALEAELEAREAERERRWAENEEMRRAIENEIIAQERRSRERQARKRAVETAERKRQAKLRDAAFAGDMETVREVVEGWVDELHGCTLIGAKVDCEDAHGHTALSEAACGGQPEVRRSPAVAEGTGRLLLLALAFVWLFGWPSSVPPPLPCGAGASVPHRARRRRQPPERARPVAAVARGLHGEARVRAGAARARRRPAAVQRVGRAARDGGAVRRAQGHAAGVAARTH